MTLMLGVVALVHRRYPQHDIRPWMAGLLLIFLECLARAGYVMPLPAIWHNTLHVLALDAYLLAGICFVRASRAGAHRLPRAILFKLVNAAPAAVLLSGYGGGIHASSLFYPVVALCGVATAIGSSVALRRPARHVVTLLAVWLPVTAATFAHRPRVASYLLLGLLYLLIALLFALNLPKRSSGKIAVVIGFAVWSACFVSHPWVAQLSTEWNSMVGEIWNMQKFLITVGFLVVLFERQVNNNEWLALHDELTGLPNRRLFQDRIGNAVARAERDRTALIVFCVDLNHFKEVNDTLGHDAGDELLRCVARNLQQVVRRTDTLARIGGDEFTLLAADVKMPSSKQERRWLLSGFDAAGIVAANEPDPVSSAGGDGLSHAAERQVVHHVTRIEQDIRSAVEQPIELRDRSGMRTVRVSAAIGAAVYPTDSTNPAELARIADQRMYEDKQESGRRGSLDRVLSLLTAS